MPSSLAATRRRPARTSSRKPTNRLGAYLAAGLGATIGITASSDAAVVTIDITNLPGSGANISGVDGGIVSGSGGRSISNWLGTGTGELNLFNSLAWGLDGDNGLEFAINGGPTSPRDFAYASSIDDSATWSGSSSNVVFRSDITGTSAPDFGPGSFMGFRFGSAGNYNFGWLGVTWTSATNQFQILSGAYESVPGVPIITPVPEPSTVALGGVGALVCGGAALRRWRKQKRA